MGSYQITSWKLPHICYQCWMLSPFTAFILTEFSPSSLPTCPVVDLEVWSVIWKSLSVLVLSMDHVFWPLVPGVVDICWAAQLWFESQCCSEIPLLRDFILEVVGKEVLELRSVGSVFKMDKSALIFSQLCYSRFLDTNLTHKKSKSCTPTYISYQLNLKNAYRHTFLCSKSSVNLNDIMHFSWWSS